MAEKSLNESQRSALQDLSNLKYLGNGIDAMYPGASKPKEGRKFYLLEKVYNSASPPTARKINDQDQVIEIDAFVPRHKLLRTPDVSPGISGVNERQEDSDTGCAASRLPVLSEWSTSPSGKEVLPAAPEQAAVSPSNGSTVSVESFESRLPLQHGANGLRRDSRQDSSCSFASDTSSLKSFGTDSVGGGAGRRRRSGLKRQSSKYRTIGPKPPAAGAAAAAGADRRADQAAKEGEGRAAAAAAAAASGEELARLKQLLDEARRATAAACEEKDEMESLLKEQDRLHSIEIAALNKKLKSQLICGTTSKQLELQARNNSIGTPSTPEAWVGKKEHDRALARLLMHHEAEMACLYDDIEVLRRALLKKKTGGTRIQDHGATRAFQNSYRASVTEWAQALYLTGLVVLLLLPVILPCRMGIGGWSFVGQESGDLLALLY